MDINLLLGARFDADFTANGRTSSRLANMLFLSALIAAPPAFAHECEATNMWRFDETCLKLASADRAKTIESMTQKLLADSDAVRRPLVKTAADSWQIYQRNQCLVEMDQSRLMHDSYSRVGTMAPSDHHRCMIRTADQRLMELRAIAARGNGLQTPR